MEANARKQIEVVAAVIRQGEAVFATQRGYGDFKDWWEFPGGKIEPGETAEEALVREIREELDAEIRVERGRDPALILGKLHAERPCAGGEMLELLTRVRHELFLDPAKSLFRLVRYAADAHFEPFVGIGTALGKIEELP